MTQAEFKSLLFVDVVDRAAAEPAPPPGESKYHRRPWLQLRHEMVDSGARTVGELRADRIRVFYRATSVADRGLLGSLRRVFGGTSAERDIA
jgi:hypothetical protein